MRIEGRLRFTRWVTILVAVAVGLLLIVVAVEVRTLQARIDVTQALAEQAFRLRNLALEYALAPNPRIVVQWGRITDRIAEGLQAIRAIDSEEAQLLAFLQGDHRSAERLFRRLQQLPPGGKARTILISQLTLRTQALSNGALQLVQARRERIVLAQQGAALAIVVLIGGLVIAVTVTSGALGRSILAPLRRLKQGAERVGGGELGHRIGMAAEDEMGELAAAFDQMTVRLQQAHRRQQESERQLSISESRYRNLFENMLDGYALHQILLDAAGRPCDYRFLEVNPAFEKILGLGEEQIRGRTVQEVLPGTEGHWIERYGRVALGGEPVTFEAYSEAFQRHFEVSASSPEHGLFAVVFRDITERKRSEQALRRANEELARTLEELRAAQQQMIQSEKLAALGTLAAGFAHELNNPLMGVLNYVAFARRRIRDPAILHPLERADEELKRIRELLKNMLSFARPSERPLRPVDLGAIIERTIQLVAPELRAGQVQFESQVPAALPVVIGREGQLQQVLLNLLLNARDAVEECADKRVVLRARSEAEAVVLEVEDSGPGIPEAIRGRIFDPFFTTKPPGKGTGLGLSIVQSAAAELGGTIQVESRPGAGAIFILKVPRAPTAETTSEG